MFSGECKSFQIGGQLSMKLTSVVSLVGRSWFLDIYFVNSKSEFNVTFARKRKTLIVLSFVLMSCSRVLVSRSNQWQQPFSYGAQRRSISPKRLQQRPQLLLLLLAGQPAAAAGLWRAAAQQAQALPHNPTAVWQRHLTGNRRAGPHVSARTSGEWLLWM